MLQGDWGFSLVELMVVVAIMGIMSIAATVTMNTSKTKLKSFVFNTKTRFNQARYEAVKRGRNVYVDLDFNDDSSIDDRLTIWVDENGDGSYDVADDGDEIGIVVFRSQSSLGAYGPTIFREAVAGGPSDTNGGPGSKDIDDGVDAGDVIDDNRFMFKPNGDSNGGLVYFYFPKENDGTSEVSAGPWAIMVNTVGRIRVNQWVSSGWK